jgi:hypothetical protein
MVAGFVLAGLDDGVLAHHASILVEDQVAVEHVRRRRVGVVGEAQDEPNRHLGR